MFQNAFLAYYVLGILRGKKMNMMKSQCFRKPAIQQGRKDIRINNCNKKHYKCHVSDKTKAL